jgi:superfamily I DNA/RNA helicase
LLVLQALRPVLPEALFFTTDLDALIMHPIALTSTRNLLVASSFGLQLRPDIQREIPPFRSSYQSAGFLATRTAIRSNDDRLPSQLLPQPLVFEIGRSGLFQFARPGEEDEETAAVGTWIAAHAKAGVMPHEFGVFVRSADQLDRAQAAAKKAGVAFKVLDENVETTSGHVSIGTMHLAKGLEFRAVAVMACDDEIIPLQQRIETVGDDADLQEVYDTERHLLYVACTRARDHLLVTGVEPVSEFLDDLATDVQGRAGSGH